MAKYEEDDYEYDDYGEEGAASKSLKGYKIVITLLAVILVAISGLYFYQSHQQRKEFAVERDLLTGRFMALSDDFANLETTNGALNDSIAMERHRTDSILEAFARERRTTRAMIREYELKLTLAQRAAENFIYQIDSLNQLNERLIGQNLSMRREIATERQRADIAEERAADADTKIRQGQRVRASGISLTLLNNNDREVTRAARAARLRIDFTLTANDLANPGNRPVYARVTGPEGYVLANPAGATFDFEGDPLVYTEMREMDYQNADLPGSIYYSGGLGGGTYKIEIYMDGMLAGSSETILR